MRIAAISTAYIPRERASDQVRYTNTPEAQSVQGSAPAPMPVQPATPSAATGDGTGNGAPMPERTFTYELPVPASATITQIADYGARGMTVDIVC